MCQAQQNSWQNSTPADAAAWKWWLSTFSPYLIFPVILTFSNLWTEWTFHHSESKRFFRSWKTPEHSEMLSSHPWLMEARRNEKENRRHCNLKIICTLEHNGSLTEVATYCCCHIWILILHTKTPPVFANANTIAYSPSQTGKKKKKLFLIRSQTRNKIISWANTHGH